MKLAFCLFKYFPYSGLSRDFLRVVLECKKRGHDISVFAAEWDGEHPDDIEVTLLSAHRWMNHSQNAFFYRRLRQELSKQNFDAVIGFNKMPGLDLYYGADYCYIGRAMPKYPMLYRLTPRYHNMAGFERAVFGVQSKTGILSLSEREKEVYQNYYATPENRFHLLPPTLDRQRLLDGDRGQIRDQMRNKLEVTDSELALFFIGSGFRTKGLDRAIRATAALPEALLNKVKLFVVGQDNETTYRRLAQTLKLNDRVSFLGGRDDIAELLFAGDLLIHPAYSENTGTVLLEAITAGLPVLTTDVCGYATHVAKANAGMVLKSPFSQEKLDARLAQMLDSKLMPQWRDNGLAYSEDSNLYRMPQSAADQIENWARNRPQTLNTQLDHVDDERALYLRDDVREFLGDDADINQVMSLSGETFREAPGRKTIRFENGSESENGYFLKAHTGVGWREIIKNIAYFRLPVLGATNEWHGIHWLKRLGIDTLDVAGYGTSSGNPARRHSFILTDEITAAISLEDYCRDWNEHPPRGGEALKTKRWLINKVARIGRALHASGANHRDFYLCHFLLQAGDGVVESTERTTVDSQTPTAPIAVDENSRLFVIDLHRMQLRKRTPQRWIVKDIAGLYYSSMEIGLTRRDLLRFIRAYRAKPLREILQTEQAFWARVEEKAQALYETEARRAARRKARETAEQARAETIDAA